MTEDSTFIKDLLASQKIPESVSDNDSSINDSDCEALIASSDDDSESHPQGSNDSKLVHKTDPTMSDTGCSSQQAINMQMLSQLQSLGKRLDAMGKNPVKKYRYFKDQEQKCQGKSKISAIGHTYPCASSWLYY